MSEYRLVESFDIDDGSLDGLTNNECFALGVEWAMVRARVLAGETFTRLCLAPNSERLSALAERHGRFVEHHPHSEGWSQIFIGSCRE